ncbi:hypothetical protein HN51_030283 [Arachis hypogaea]
MRREENDGGIPKNMVKEKREKNKKNQNGEGGKDIDRGKGIIEELGNFLQNLAEKGRDKHMGQHETGPKQKETEYEEKREENHVGLSMKENLDSQRESANHKPKNFKMDRNINMVDLCNNRLSMIEKEGNDECQSKALTIHKILLAIWEKGREEAKKKVEGKCKM